MEHHTNGRAEKLATTKKQIDVALGELAAAIEQGRTDELTEYLATMARFHDYSYRNVLLIQAQKPEATLVAGYRAWNELGRFVKKGERGIRIIAPLVYRQSSESDAKQSDGDETEVAGFKVVYVFDVSQTDGKDLPQQHVASGQPGEMLKRLHEVYAKHKIRLRYDLLGRASGYLTRDGSVVLDQRLSPAEEFHVGVHELAHKLMRHFDRKLGKKAEETEAEAVAFVVSHAVGLDAASSDYLLSQGANPETLAMSLDRIQFTASSILADLLSSS